MPTLKKIFAHLEVSAPSILTKSEVMDDRLLAALPLPVGGNVRHALKEKAQAHDTHLKAVSVKLDGLRQQLASLPVEDLTSRTKVVSDVGLEALKHMLSSLKLDCQEVEEAGVGATPAAAPGTAAPGAADHPTSQPGSNLTSVFARDCDGFQHHETLCDASPYRRRAACIIEPLLKP